jgi:hypothetical protein
LYLSRLESSRSVSRLVVNSTDQLQRNMAKSSNIVHQYFKKDFEEFTILVKVNPIQLIGTEVTIRKNGEAEIREMEFDQEIFDDLKQDGFIEASPLEFNLYISGLA